MRNYTLALAASALAVSGCESEPAIGTAEESAVSAQERNKGLALEFYQNLWFTDNTGAYADYVADEYVIHDIGDKPGAKIVETAYVQKSVADRFHSMGTLSGKIDYQIAEGDKVATRWYISLEPNEEATAAGMTAVKDVPIINVFRFNDEGKIVEIWNHRHDVSLPRPPGNMPDRPAMRGDGGSIDPAAMGKLQKISG